MTPISVHKEVRIKAPAADVWAKLVDTTTWPEWNSFVSQAELLDTTSSARSNRPQVFTLGSRRRFIVNMNGFKQSLIQKVTIFEIPSDGTTGPKIYRISWAIQNYPRYIFNTLRYNEIEEMESSDGPMCIYRTGEDQSGPMAYFVKLAFGKNVERGITNWANDLKAASEADCTKKEEHQEALPR